MSLNIKNHSGGTEAAGRIFIKPEWAASLWVKTAAGAVRIWEAALACFSAVRWRPRRPWLYKERWRY